MQNENKDTPADNEDINEASWFSVIPAKVLNDTTLSPSAKLLYGKISALVHSKGYCFASNARLAAEMHKCKTSISLMVSALKKAGCIKIDYSYRPGTREILERRIYNLETMSLLDEKRKIQIQKKSTEKTGIRYEEIRDAYECCLEDLKMKEKIAADSILAEESWKAAVKLADAAVKSGCSVGQLVKAVQKAARDSFIVENGYVITMILSGKTLNRLINIREKDTSSTSSDEFKKLCGGRKKYANV